MNPWLRVLVAGGSLALTALFSGCDVFPVPTAREGAPRTAALFPAEEGAPIALDPALLQPGDATFRLGPGDRLQIDQSGDPGSRAVVTVGPDGKIYYSLLSGIDVWGLTLSQVRDRLAQGLQAYVREKPQVSVALRGFASQRVWVLGRVTGPGVYTLSGPTTLLDAIARAGGPTSGAAALPGPGGTAATAGGGTADLAHSFLIRQGRMLPIDFQKLLEEGDLSQNVYLQPDDFIYLPSSRTGQVYILGAVILPQAERMTGSLTVVQAIALARGTDRGASLANVAILRGSLTDPKIAIVHVDLILHGQAPDVRLEPGDIVYVPYSPPGPIAMRYIDLILNTFARTVGINAGARAVSGNASAVGVGVSVTP